MTPKLYKLPVYTFYDAIIAVFGIRIANRTDGVRESSYCCARGGKSLNLPLPVFINRRRWNEVTCPNCQIHRLPTSTSTQGNSSCFFFDQLSDNKKPMPRSNLPSFSTVLPSDSCCFCRVGLSLYLGPRGMRMGSGEGSTMRNFIVCTVHLI